MSEVTTTYRGHTIRWSDNSDEWTCYDLSDKVRSSPKLSNIKAAIDRLYLAERKANAVPCFEVSRSGAKRAESSIVEYLGEKRRASWNGKEVAVEHKVAVVAKRRDSERPARSEKEISQLMPRTDEAEGAWSAFVELDCLAEQAKARADAAFQALPRITPEDVAALIALHERGEDA